MMNDRPKPAAEGSLSKTPFAHILVYLLQRGMSGTLEVQAGGHTVSVYFREGRPAKVRSSIEGKTLGEVLLLTNLVSKAQLDVCRKDMERSGGLLGEVMIRRGVIDATDLVRGLREQMLLQLVDLFAVTSGTYSFYDKVNLLVGIGAEELIPIETYSLLAAGVRTHGDRMSVGQVLASLRGRWIRVDNVDAAARFGFKGDARRIVRELIGEPVSFDEIWSSDRHDRRELGIVLYTMLITKELTVLASTPAPEPEAEPKPRRSLLSTIPPPPAERESLDPEVRALREQIQQKAASIAAQNYFEMLELPMGAQPVDVRKAFFRLAKIYHPDRSAKAGLRDLADTLEYVFSNLSEANAILIEPETRQEYEASLREGTQRTSVIPPTEADAEVRDALEAEKMFQRALVFMRKGDYAEGLKYVDQARLLNPNEGEYLAAWAHMHAQSRSSESPVQDLLESLRRALDMAPNSERVHLYLAQLLKRAGHADESADHFRRVVEINPRNIEAMREVRLAGMRRTKDKGDKKKGLFGKLLR